MIAILKYRIPAYITLILMIAAITLYFFSVKKIADTYNLSIENSHSTPVVKDNFTIKRLSGYDFISPLLFVDEQEKSPEFSALLQKTGSFIESKKVANEIINCSFYLKNSAIAKWTGYNENEKYLPGSMLKVAVLISYLRLEELHPGTLEKKLFYATPFNDGLKPTYISTRLQPGKSYTIKELLHYMIAYSDNDASSLLDNQLPVAFFNKMLTDLGLEPVQQGAANYPISSKDYSLFMWAIYNASYLTIAHSEYAAELLNASDFKDGFQKGFPSSVKMIHKFGESGTEQEHYLNESGIIYLNNTPYVLTIMTKGADLKKLSSVIGDLSAIIYEELVGMSKS